MTFPPNSPAHFQMLYDALPDLDTPPSDGPHCLGDLCKVRARAMVWAGEGWIDLEKANSALQAVEKTAAP